MTPYVIETEEDQRAADSKAKGFAIISIFFFALVACTVPYYLALYLFGTPS